MQAKENNTMGKTFKLIATFIYGIFANDVDAWTPEYWANESIAILEENMVIGNMVHRDFENIIAESGDIVNTRKPGEFTVKRKDVNDQITVQNATATNIQVPLNQHLHVSFIIKDKEQSLSFRDLVNEYLKPALLAVARGIDKILLYQAPRYVRTDRFTAGSLGGSESIATILDTGKNLNDDKCPPENRNMIITTKGHNTLMKISDFLNADKVGDQGTALREASIGRKLGFNFFMCQNTCYPQGTVDTLLGAINLAAGYVAGDTVLTVDSFTGAVVTGANITIEGDMIPHRITAHTETLGNTTSITITPGLKTAVANNAVVTQYTPGAVNLVAGYAAGYAKYIEVDGLTNGPVEGQWVSFTPTGARYVIIEKSGTTILLDRPLEAAIVNNDVAYYGPLGAFNFAFCRNALALVTRPLALPRSGAGAQSAVANYRGLSVRVVISYDPYEQGTLVTVDLLCGVAILEQALAEVMFG
jgi:hypothetical protein